MKNLLKTKIGVLIFLLSLLLNFNFVRAENIENQIDLGQTTARENQGSVPLGQSFDKILVVPANENASEIGGGHLINNSDEFLTSNTDAIDITPISEKNESNADVSAVDPKATTTTQPTSDAPIDASTMTTDPSTAKDATRESSPVENKGSVSPVATVGDTKEYDFPTYVTRSENFVKTTILAEWQMLDLLEDDNFSETDNSMLGGAQILPSGQYGVDKNFSVCALVADSQEMKNEVSATISYPDNVAYAANQTERGCGKQARQLTLSEIDDNTASLLICDELRSSNNNLITWNKNELEKYTYNYSQVCGLGGFLAEKKVKLYCASTTLAFDDPAGNYLVEISSKNINNEIVTSSSNLKYLELTVLENDFSDIQYGMVTQNVSKYLSGDQTWDNAEHPTVRNAGNTRLKINIWQNDFNLGKTDGSWNVSYKAKIGNDPVYIDYYPEKTTTLNSPLNLGETINIDLAILILDYPENKDQVSFSGKMILTTTRENDFLCKQ